MLVTNQMLERENGAGHAMNDKLFNELVESIKEAGAYLRGEQPPARITVVSEPDPPFDPRPVGC